jgi:hypothetical protein
MKGLSRLVRLEKVAAVARASQPARQQDFSESEARFDANWAIMAQTMSEEHIQLVVEAYAAGAQYVTSDLYRTPGASLLRRCLNALWPPKPDWPHSLISPEVALAMPPHVAEVYLQDQHAIPLHECEDCGYRVPHGYFEACPLCNGRVGWSAFWHKHKDDPRTEQ